MTKKKEKKGFPHTYVILLGIAVLVAFLTWVVPAGEFERIDVDGRTMVVPDSYRQIEANPQNPWDFLQAIPEGLNETADIIFFIFIVGGVFNIIMKTGMIEAGIGKISKSMKNKEWLIIPAMITIFSIAGGTIGLSEETIVFIPIGIVLAESLGYDRMVGFGMITLGASVGFNAGFMNPFTIGVAQGVAELPFTSGLALRMVLLVVLILVTSWYLISYGHKIKKDPTLSVVYNKETGSYFSGEEFMASTEMPEFTGRHKLVLLTMVIGFGLIAFGAAKWGWYIGEIGSTFLGMGIISGLVGGQSFDQMADIFIDGAKDVVFAALVVGVARVILVVMEKGLIIDTIIHFLSSLISGLPKLLGSIGMYIIQIVINFFIPSGSGQAAATMPIMVPLGDTLGLTRQTTVLAFQLGDGFMDSIIPTSGVLMAQLAVAKIGFNKYAKWVGKLMALWLIAGMIFLVFATIINYGPF